MPRIETSIKGLVKRENGQARANATEHALFPMMPNKHIKKGGVDSMSILGE